MSKNSKLLIILFVSCLLQVLSWYPLGIPLISNKFSKSIRQDNIPSKRSRDIYLSSVMEKPSKTIHPDDKSLRNGIFPSAISHSPDPDTSTQKKYLTAPLSTMHTLGKKMTYTNKLYSETGLKFRSKFMKLRQLTPEEESTAGKFSSVGKRLHRIKNTLYTKLKREPTTEEWARASGLTVKTLEQYLLLSEKARNRLIQHNIRLVDTWVRRIIEHSYAGKKVSYFELISEGIIGLSKAAMNYDGRAYFMPYAEFWVRSAIYHGLTKLRPGHLSTHRDILLNIKFNRVKSDLQQELRREPTDEEIALKLKIKTKTLQTIRRLANLKVVSAQTELSGDLGAKDSPDPNNYYALQLKADQSDYRIEEILWKNDVKEAMRNCLTTTERRTLDLRYGLLTGNQKSVDKTAALMCTSSEAIRKIVIRAIHKLRIYSAKADNFLEQSPAKEITIADGRYEAKTF